MHSFLRKLCKWCSMYKFTVCSYSNNNSGNTLQVATCKLKSTGTKLKCVRINRWPPTCQVSYMNR